MKLVITEKPSVARSIAAVIGATEKQNGYWQGGGYLVSWCIGHLVSFAEAGQYDEKYCKWRYEDLPILPQPWQFIVPDEKKPQFEIVRALLNRSDVDSVTAATDAGREGELIFRFVYQMAGCTKPVKRLWISSMEDAAIREGFANLRPDSDYDALYQSALCRAKAGMENEQRQSRIASSPAAKRFQLSGFIGGILLFVVRCGGGCNIQRTAAQEGRELVRLHVHAAHQLNNLQVFLFSLCSFQFFQLLLVFRDFFFEPFNIALNARKSFCHTKSFLASR